MQGQLGQIMNNKIQKSQNPTAVSEVLGAKAGYCTRTLPTTPPKSPLHLIHGSTPTLTPFNTPSSCKEICCLFLLPLPIKPSLISAWIPPINFYWLKSSRKQVGNKISHITLLHFTPNSLPQQLGANPSPSLTSCFVIILSLAFISPTTQLKIALYFVSSHNTQPHNLHRTDIQMHAG